MTVIILYIIVSSKVSEGMKINDYKIIDP